MRTIDTPPNGVNDIAPISGGESLDLRKGRRKSSATAARPVASADETRPHDHPNERAVLACGIRWPHECSPVFNEPAEAFQDQRNIFIFQTLCAMHRSGAAIDSVTIASALKDDIERAGGWEYVASLPDAAASPANLSTYLATLHGKYIVRAALQSSDEMRLQMERHPAHAATIIRHYADTLTSLSRSYISADALPAIVSATEFLADEIPTPPQLVSNFLYRGSKMVLAGGSKSFKTWTLLDLGVSVAAGADWWGMSTTLGIVLYINLELKPFSIQRRIIAVKGAKGIGDVPNFRLWNLRGRSAALPRLTAELMARDADANLSMIIIDPIYKCLGGRDENAAGDIGQMLNEIESLSERTGAAVVFGAHHSKGNQAGKESIDRASGSGVFARDPDAIVDMAKHEQDGAFTVEPTLRDFPPHDPFVVRWEYPLMRRAEDLDPEKLKQPKGRTKTHSEKEMLALLPRVGMSTKDWQATADAECGTSRRTFYTLKAGLDKAGKITFDRITDKWRAA